MSAVSTSPVRAGLRGTNRMWAGSRFLAVLILLVALFGYFSATRSVFLTGDNIANLLTSVSILFMVSIGMTFVMLSGGIDLSAGAFLALTGIILAKITVAGVPIGLAIVLTILAGALLGGFVNGLLIGPLKLSFLVVTLGTFALFSGVVNLWSDTKTIQLSSGFLDALAFNSFVGIPIPVWIMIGVYLGALYVLRWTFFGRDVYAVGGNADAARLSGVSVSKTLIAVYAIAGLLIAVGGVIQTARVGAASPLVGGSIVFDAAAAVLLGGTSFVGGVGGVTGTAIGVLFLGVLQNGLAVSGVQSFWQQVVTGLILIVTVVLDRARNGGWPEIGALLSYRLGAWTSERRG